MPALKKLIEIPPLTPEKAYILGVIGPGDGCIKREDTIGLQVKDMDFAKKFSSCLQEVYGKHGFSPRYSVVAHPDKKNPYYCTELYGTDIIRKDILSYGGIQSFKEGKEKVPQQITHAGKEIKAAYLRAFFDSQGSVNVSKLHGVRAVEGTKKNLPVIRELRNLLNDFGIKSWVRMSQDGTYRLNITGKPNLEQFRIQIGFSIKRKQRKLNEALKSYNHRSPYELDQFLPIMRELRTRGVGTRRASKILRIDQKTIWRKLRRGFFKGSSRHKNIYGG